MKYTELDKHLNAALNGSEAFFSVYLVGGADAYLRQSAGRKFKALVSPEYSDFNLSYVPRDKGASAIADALQLYPVFDERKVVIVPDVGDKLSEGEKGVVSSYLTAPNPTSILVIISEGEGDKDLVKKQGVTYVDCSKLTEGEISVEADKLLSAAPSIEMENGALHILVEKTSSDMSRIVSEIEKLKSYSSGIITRRDVEEMVTSDLEYAVYELTSAVSEKQADRALVILDVFTKQGAKPTSIISMLYDRYRKMLHAELHKADDEKTLASLLEVSPGALYHLKRVSKNYSQMKLKKCVDYLHNLQYAILSGKRNEDTALHEAVLTLLNV